MKKTTGLLLSVLIVLIMALLVTSASFSLAEDSKGKTGKQIQKKTKKDPPVLREGATKALNTIRVRVSTGVTYQDYVKLVSESSVDVVAYLESPKAKNDPELAPHIEKAFMLYKNAATVWSFVFRDGDILILSYKPLPIATFHETVKIYPKAQDMVEGEIGTSGMIILTDVVHSIWKDAKDEMSVIKDMK